ncbi:MAG: 2Fe-2S iron-sulfur cluster-binding protein [Eubacteriales bacterium]|nr:2Fe-2S iron-sulfur cluster-binding protein [Eubacteriales bacterium]
MKIKIDEMEIDAILDETIMTAAKRADLFIPGLCYDEATGGGHNCRLCMVEVEERGRQRLVAACAFQVKDGLIVKTESERVLKIRKTLLELLYLEAPTNEVVLSLMDRCGVTPPSSLPMKEQGKNGIDACILCSRCVNACAKLGAAAISTIGRGVIKEVNTPYGKAADTCIGCASCAEVCPLKTIKVSDTEEGRTIWGKSFEWMRCETCGTIITTKEHYLSAEKALQEKGSPLPPQIMCPTCKRKYMSDVFASSLGEADR